MANWRFRNAAAAVALIGALAVAPANAAKVLPGVGAVPFTGSEVTLFGGDRGIDNTTLGQKPDVFFNDPQAVAAVPEPAAWLMMMLGFGLLGVITRRTNPTLAEARRNI